MLSDAVCNFLVSQVANFKVAVCRAGRMIHLNVICFGIFRNCKIISEYCNLLILQEIKIPLMSCGFIGS